MNIYFILSAILFCFILYLIMIPLENSKLQKKNKKIGFLMLVFFCLAFNKLNAQVQNNGMIYVGDNATIYIQSGDFAFGPGSSTTTSTTTGTYGKLQFGASATISGAASGASLFINGYVSTLSSNYFLLPTGQSTIYAPIGITNTSVTNGVSATYSIASPPNSVNLSTSIAALNQSGYWNVFGDNAKLTIIWSSDISALSSSIANLTVAGYNISSDRWEAILSETPTGSTISGTIQTSNAINLGAYSAFTLAKRAITCAPIFAASGTTKTWNGSWSPSAPTEIDPAVIAGAGAPGSFVCNTLVVNANISLTDGQTIEVVNGITGTGVITMSSQASVYQRNDASEINPTIALTKSTRNGMYVYDYIYWGTPLKSSVDSFALLATARAYDNSNSFTTGAVGALDNFYKYVSGISSPAGGWQALSSNPVSGSGFITRIKQQAPFATFQVQNNSDHINLTFLGAANNGTIAVPIANIPGTPSSSRNFNLLGNPYPSAISADKFLEYNTDLDGVVYLWKATTPNTGLAGASYGVADYIAYTRAGSTSESGISSTPFNGNIASGQGFKVKSITTSGTGNAIFNNCMRISSNNNQFMRSNNSQIIDRFRLNLKGTNNVGNQILIAYMPETSLGYDRLYDAELNSVSPAQIYSILDNTTTQLGINARPNFATTDVVALGINKSNITEENFNIAIADKEGVFQGTEINVLLHDKQLNIFHNLANGQYNFIMDTNQLANRFEVVYQQAALGNYNFIDNNVFATINNQSLKISTSLPVTNVAVYDLSGRLIKNLPIDNQLQINSPFHYASGIYIVKIKMKNGEIATRKLINN